MQPAKWSRDARGWDCTNDCISTFSTSAAFQCCPPGIFFLVLWVLKFGKCFQIFIKFSNLHFFFPSFFCCYGSKTRQKNKTLYTFRSCQFMLWWSCAYNLHLWEHPTLTWSFWHTSNSQTSLESRPRTGWRVQH
jgi:hypothetical protein